jgi:hypothetical protein
MLASRRTKATIGVWTIDAMRRARMSAPFLPVGRLRPVGAAWG